MDIRMLSEHILGWPRMRGKSTPEELEVVLAIYFYDIEDPVLCLSAVDYGGHFNT